MPSKKGWMPNLNPVGLCMKKLVLIIALGVCTGLALFADTNEYENTYESWWSFGFEFGNELEFFDDDRNIFGDGSGQKKHLSYIGSPGFEFDAYVFADKKNVGFFLHYSFLFSTIFAGDGNNDDYSRHFEFLLGVAFRKSLGEKSILHYGIGFDFALLSSNYKDKIDLSNYGSSELDVTLTAVGINLGIGGNIGLKYDFTDSVYLDFGAAISYFFFNGTSVDAEFSGTNNSTTSITLFDDRIRNYGMATIKPYIAIGFNYWSMQKGGRGKLKGASKE
ncbi:MAG: hypothetical protein Ta2G_01370 [Termitinemataceae bacterium]|nr:MAG: hypothetical protein Ta2G_01370 [Termitinemataceae bacterium]